jgi:ATP-dependent DNA helicase RecQ
METPDNKALEMLNTVFGYESFRGQQQSIIEHLVSGRDALVVMPTGSGKSLCYQIPALIRPGVGIVISPLIALMQDQVSALLQLGITAAFLNSNLAFEELPKMEKALLSGDLGLLYSASRSFVYHPAGEPYLEPNLTSKILSRPPHSVILYWTSLQR